MGKAEKALKRLESKPSDYTWSELVSVMNSLGYEMKTNAGSSRKFIHPITKATLMLHEPHPSSILKAYQIRAVLAFLKQERHL